MVRREYRKLAFYEFEPLTSVRRLMHAVTTREGGKSASPFDTLNLALHVGDEPSKVVTNRHAVCDALDVMLEDWVTADQVHRDQVSVVGPADRGRGARKQTTAVPHTDALATNARGVVLALFSADCPLILLVDRSGASLALVHASWRTTVAGLSQRTVRTMTERFGTKPHDLLAAIAPSIGPNCYAVGADVLVEARKAATGCERFLKPTGGRLFFDLWGANFTQLMAAGVPAANIFLPSLCSHCRIEEFFSYRLEGSQTGRFAFIACLK